MHVLCKYQELRYHKTTITISITMLVQWETESLSGPRMRREEPGGGSCLLSPYLQPSPQGHWGRGLLTQLEKKGFVPPH
jgi:hypothetical protein